MAKSQYTKHNEIFLDLLRRSRERALLRQSDLARRLGRDQGSVSRIESGERRLDIVQLRDWLGALDVDFVSFANELDSLMRNYPAVDVQLLSRVKARQLRPGR